MDCDIIDRKEIVKMRLIEWSSSSTAHGFPNIIRNNNKSLRFMWIICFVISLSSCTFMIIRSIMDYRKYDVITQIRVVTESPTLFPTVTLCNINPFPTEYARSFLDSFYNLSNSSSTQDVDPTFIAQYIKGPDFPDEQRKKLGFYANETIIFAQFNSVPIRYKDFEWYFSYMYGNCYKFNSGYDINGNRIPLLNLSASGLINGLNLEMFIGVDKNNNFIKYSRGIHLFIHHNTNQPNSFEGIDIKPGTVTNIVINKSVIRKLPIPYSECQDLTSFDSELYRFIKKSRYTYRQKDCFDLCISKRINENCGCNDQYYTPLTQLRTCLTEEDLNCSHQTFLEINNNLNEKCLGSCPLECETVTYHLSTSMAEYPSLAYGEVLKNNSIIKKYFPNDMQISDIQIKKSTLAINIYYEDLKYTMIKELPNQTLIGLISGIGGTLGLFLGISLLSLIEVVEIVINILIICVKKRTGKTRLQI